MPASPNYTKDETRWASRYQEVCSLKSSIEAVLLTLQAIQMRIQGQDMRQIVSLTQCDQFLRQCFRLSFKGDGYFV